MLNVNVLVRKNMQAKPSILKHSREEILHTLKYSKQRESQEKFKTLISQSVIYDGLPAQEQSALLKNAAQIGLSIVASTSWTLKQNHFSAISLKYLRDIQKSDGTMPPSYYWDLVKSGKIYNDQLSIKLIRICSADYNIQKVGISSFKALPDNLDEKPYKEDYMRFCVNATKEIMQEVLDIVESKLQEDQVRAQQKRKSVSWREKLSDMQEMPFREGGSHKPVRKKRKVAGADFSEQYKGL